MNYQFKRDLNGRPLAQFDMGSEIFSLWFSEELSADQHKIDEVYKAIKQLQNELIKEYVLSGSDINLSLNRYEVEARSKNLDCDAPEELPEGTELYDQESIAGCGLEDFISVLDSWHEFITEN